MAFNLFEAFYAACPGVPYSRDIDTALALLAQPATGPQILAAVLPLIGGALPLYPVSLKRFADSNPTPLDGWSIERSTEGGPGFGG